MSLPRILIQLDGDAQASTFDAVVAVDAGVDHLLTRQGVSEEQVSTLVHGAIFTRGPSDLRNTAIFVGGSDVAAGERLLSRVVETFFGPMRVSVMMDANGANTTAAAAVLAARRHVELAGATAVVLGGTGPVGQRAALLLAKEGAQVRLASRKLDRAQAACNALSQRVSEIASRLTACQAATDQETRAAMKGVQVVIAAGALGVQLLSESDFDAYAQEGGKSPKTAIDLNAAPPVGIEGVEFSDKAAERNGVFCYGAIGVGGSKMKIHKAVLRKLFEHNNLVFDAEEIYNLGKEIAPKS